MDADVYLGLAMSCLGASCMGAAWLWKHITITEHHTTTNTRKEN